MHTDNRMNIMNRDMIKYAAMVTMFLNHTANIFMKQGTVSQTILVDIGYFTAPVMCFFLVEGYHYTASVSRYVFRLGLFALLSELPFCLAFSELYNGIKTISFCGFNMIFTLFICLCILIARDRITDPVMKSILISGLFILSCFSDWSIVAPVFVLLFARAGNDSKKQGRAFTAGAVLFAFLKFASMPESADILHQFLSAVLSTCSILAAGFIIVYMYTGKRCRYGRTFSKWFFYIFYPAHLLVLGILRVIAVR